MSVNRDLFKNNYDRYYDYPYDLDLRPTSELHKRLVDAVKDRARRGYQTVSDKRDTWRKLDHHQNAYVPANQQTIFEMKKDPKSAVNVVIPLSRAFLDIFVAYQGGQMLGDPSGPYALTARGDKERLVAAAKMDRLINTQSVWFRHALKHFINLRDQNLYGIGVMMPFWNKHKRKEPVIDEVSNILYEMIKDVVDVKPNDLIRYLETVIVHEGSEIENIDPYALIIDPNAKLNDYQKAEFMGYYHRTNAMQLLFDEEDPEQRLFNCRYARDLAEQSNGRTSETYLQQSGRFDTVDSPENEYYNEREPQADTTNEVDTAHLFWHTIPAKWGISGSEHPEWFQIDLSCDEVITRFQKIEYDHGHNPMLFSGPTTTGYDMFPVSGLEATHGMQEFVDWKVRSHWFNASKVQNDMFIADASAIEIDDLRNPGPGKIIRVKRPLLGTANIDQFVKQFKTMDVTQNYINDIAGMNELFNRVLGTHDILSGNMAQMPERPTAVGLSMAQGGASDRMRMYGQITTDQQWYTFVDMLCRNNLQFMEHPMVVSIVGSRFETQIRTELGIPEGVNTMNVDPWDLNMDLDIMPLNRMQKEMNLTAMNMLADRMLQIPEISMEVFAGMDVRGFFLSLVRQMGFPDVHEYVKSKGQLPPVNPQVIPDEQLNREVEAGNLVPTQEVAPVV